MRAVSQLACAAAAALTAACSGSDSRNEAAGINAAAQQELNTVTTGVVLPITNETAAGATEPEAPAAGEPAPAARRVPTQPPRSDPPPPPPPPAPADPHAGHDMNDM